MKSTAVLYVLFSALIGFACGSVHSCMERDRRTIVTPKEVKIEPFDLYDHGEQVDL